LSWDISDAWTSNSGNNQNRYDFRSDRSFTPYVPREYGVITAVYEFPLGKGHALGSTWPGALRSVAGGWKIAGFLTAQTGQYATPMFSGVDTSNTNTIGGRAEVVGNWHVANQTIQQWFNPAAFAIPLNGQFGNAGLFTIEGPSKWNLDAAVYKTVSITERASLRFEASALNALNHPAFGLPITDITNPLVGQITSTDQNGTVSSTGRAVQFGVRFAF
jgi:hypothetical protein